MDLRKPRYQRLFRQERSNSSHQVDLRELACSCALWCVAVLPIRWQGSLAADCRAWHAQWLMLVVLPQARAARPEATQAPHSLITSQTESHCPMQSLIVQCCHLQDRQAGATGGGPGHHRLCQGAGSPACAPPAAPPVLPECDQIWSGARWPGRTEEGGNGSRSTPLT